MKHPMQKVVFDDHDVIRFQSNEIIKWLFNTGKLDLNEIACMPFSDEDRTQVAQLLGYSVSGIGDLSYVKGKTIWKADRRAAKLREMVWG